MLKRISNLILVFSFLVFCSGCWDGADIEDRASVLSLSFDLVDGQYEVGAAIPVPSKIESGGAQADDGGGNQGLYIVNVKANSLNEAFDKITTIVQRPIYFGQTVVLVFSKEIAEKGLNPIIDYIHRNEEFRIHAHLVVVEGKAVDFIKTPSAFWKLSMQELNNDLENAEELGYGYRQGLGQFLVEKNTISKGTPTLNLISVSEDEFKWEGIALFQQDKMVHKLTDGELVSVLNQIKNNLPGLSIRIPCEQGIIAFFPTRASTNIEIDTDPLTPKPKITVKVKGFVEEKTCPLDLNEEQNINKIEKEFARHYEENAKKLIQLGKDLHLNLFPVWHHMRMNHPEVWEKYKDLDKFLHLPIEVQYDVNVLHSGVSSQ